MSVILPLSVASLRDGCAPRHPFLAPGLLPKLRSPTGRAAAGTASLKLEEYVIAADPDVYIATGSPGGTYTTFSIGPGVDPSEARRSLAEPVKMPDLAPLKAVREGNVHGIWNFFNAVPLNILAAEAVAT
jgi:ABC-type Fe3+-hydroxamate transport system substrate-binding protein